MFANIKDGELLSNLFLKFRQSFLKALMNVNTFYRMKRQEPSVMKLTLLMKKLELTKQLSDKGLPMVFVNSTETYF